MQFPFLALSIHLLAIQTVLESLPTTLVERQAVSDLQSGFQGNNGAYGFGIRLVIHIQWVSVALTGLFSTDNSWSVAGITNCFHPLDLHRSDVRENLAGGGRCGSVLDAHNGHERCGLNDAPQCYIVLALPRPD